MCPQVFEVLEGLAGDHARPRTLDVHDVPHPSSFAFGPQGFVEGPQVHFAVRLYGVHDAVGQVSDRAGDGLPLEQGLPAGPADVADSAVSRRGFDEDEAAHLLHDLLDGSLAEVFALDGVHRVAPRAAEVAGVQPDEDRGRPDEAALALDAEVAFAEEEGLAGSCLDGCLLWHSERNQVPPTVIKGWNVGAMRTAGGP